MAKIFRKNKIYRWAKKEEKKYAKRIAAARIAGENYKADDLTLKYLNSYAANVLATFQANQKLPDNKRVGLEAILEIAKYLDVWNASHEKVVVHQKPKKHHSAHYRMVMRFDIKNRARQILVKNALIARCGLRDDQYGAGNGGRNAGCDIARMNLEEGYHHVIHVDLNDAYASVNGEKVSGLLPIPYPIVRNVILSKHYYLFPGNFHLHLDESTSAKDHITHACCDALLLGEARHGLPQGSAVSPLILELLLAPVLSGLTEYGRVVCYADNILIMAKDGDAAGKMLLSLGAGLTQHPVGPLSSRIEGKAGPGQSFEFLGYEYSWSGGSAVLKPSPKNNLKHQYKFDRFLRHARDKSLSKSQKLAELEAAQSYVRQWTAAFSLSKGINLIRTREMAQIDLVKNEISSGLPTLLLAVKSSPEAGAMGTPWV